MFTPTIPQRRVKKNIAADGEATPKATPTPSVKPKKERPRKTKQFVTSASVFSMGPADKRRSMSLSLSLSLSPSLPPSLF